MQEPMPCDTVVVQGPIRLADAWCCLDCEVLFTSLARCPRCASSAIWPVAAWVSPALPHLGPNLAKGQILANSNPVRPHRRCSPVWS
jgi:hypothetical protein